MLCHKHVNLSLDWSAWENAGIDVMITIFCDFFQFAAKKIGVFFLKNHCYDQNFAKLSFVLSQKQRQVFSPIFWRKYF
jgi:hypothetical protein